MPISNTNCFKASVTDVRNPPPFSSAGPFALWTQTSWQIMTDVNWGFGTVGFGPKLQEFDDAFIRYFVPQDIQDANTLAYRDSVTTVLAVTDLELYLRFR